MKICVICGKPIMGKARKYCPDCKNREHLEQMSQYYKDHTKEWMIGGKYWDQQMQGRCGTGSLGEHAFTTNWDKEAAAIQKELQNLQLRDRKENWRYKNN